MEFMDLLWPSGGGIAALVGGGGKTSIMGRVAEEAAFRGVSLLVTVTTKIQRPCPVRVDRIHCAENRGGPIPAAGERVLWVGEPVAGGRKWSGPCAPRIDAAAAAAPDLPILVEADGAAGRPVKAPGEGEPVIPSSAETVAAVVGLSALGRPIDGTLIHRLACFLELTGAKTGDVLTPEHIALVLAHPLGTFKGSSPRARRIVVLNQADRDIDVRNADRIIDALQHAEIIGPGEAVSAGPVGFAQRVPAGTKAVVSSIGNGPAIRSIVSL